MKKAQLFCVLAVGLALSGVNCPPVDPQKPRVANLRGFDSPEELQQYLAEQASVTAQGTRGTGNPLLDFFGALASPMSAAPAATGDSAATAENSAPSFSTTNIQEVGIDESDIVKNDSAYIYSLDGQNIHVVRANPPGEMAEVATIAIPPSGNSLYLTGSTLVALSTQGYYAYYGGFGGMPTIQGDPAESGGGNAGSGEPGPDIFPDRPEMTVTIIDVSDPANPVTEATATFEGNLQSSRLIGTKLHLILSSFPQLPNNPTPLNLRNMPLEDWLPKFQVVDTAGAVVQSGTTVGWQGVFRPESPDGYQITTVVTLDVANPTASFASTAVTANSGVIYASANALYLTDTNYDYELGSAREDTIIHKLAFTDSGTQYVASGLIPGRPLNQYSLGEYNDYLRIATHISNFDFNGGQESNSLYVLAANGAALEVTGKIENIAPGEQIYSARFVGDRGFLVTFRRVDPLFVIDLADPANPVIKGELKVPGYSDHIQMLDENHLLTIGKDAQEAGDFAWIQGVQVSLFDVTDEANPALLHKVVIGGRGTNSEANYNPKAFIYYPEQNALAFPVDVYSGQTSGPMVGTHDFTGLYVYRVTVADGINLLGRIGTTSGFDSSGCFLGYYGYTRGVFIDNTVYAVTQANIKAADLGDLTTLLGQVDFAEPATLYRDCFTWPVSIPSPGGEGLR